MATVTGSTSVNETPPLPPTNESAANNDVTGVTRTTLDSSTEGDPQPRTQLEDFTRCSDCHLWKLMMSFYERKGIDSWSQGVVPHFITSNSFIGRSYAKVLQGFIRDCAAGKMKLDPDEPLYIIELGVGSGKFSFYMMKALMEMQATLDFPVKKLVYVMTDFTDENVKFWREHPQLKEYFDNGSMDCAIFDAVADTKLELIHSKVTLEAGKVKNPICIVANYLFDTLCHDIFQVHPAEAGSEEGAVGVLKEGLVAVGSRSAEEPDPLDPEIIKRLDNLYRYDDISTNYYDDKEEGDHEHLQRILAWYEHAFSGVGKGADRTGASLLVPIGALRALNRLTGLSKGRCIVISGDKGNNNPECFRGLINPHIAVHGSFSVMVNYHAIGMYFTSRGGFAVHNPQEEASLKVSAFVLQGDESKDETGVEGWTGDAIEKRDELRVANFPYLREAFFNHVESFGPNDFFVMQKALKEDSEVPTLKAVVALLKLADWDPDVFHKFRDTILNQIPTYGHKLRNDLMRGIPRVWLNHYTLDKDKDIAFEIGRFYYGVRDYHNALTFYALSSKEVGAHHVTSHNMGLCKYSMHLFPEAKEYFEESLTLNKDYEKAATWLAKVNQELDPATRKEVTNTEPLPDNDSSSSND